MASSEWPKLIQVCPECGAQEHDPPTSCSFCERSGGHLSPVAVFPGSTVRGLAEALDWAIEYISGFDDHPLEETEPEDYAKFSEAEALLPETRRLLAAAQHLTDQPPVQEGEHHR